MDTIIRRKAQLSVAAVAALAIFAVAAVMLLAGGFSTDPAQAQGGGGTDGSTDSNTSPWPDPQPCGPGASTAFQPEPHEVTEGHFALFDSYEYIEGDLGDDAERAPSPSVLRANTCPPKVTITTGDEKTITRKESNIDIDEAIFHVKDTYQTTVVANNADITNGQLSLEDYPMVGEIVDAGDKVWWLRLDDPDTPADETSDLTLGFSTALLHEQYWLTSADLDDQGRSKALRYMFEVERFPGAHHKSEDGESEDGESEENQDSESGKLPHFFAYEAPKKASQTASDEKRVKRVWDSTRVHYPGEVVQMNPGEYKDLQWIFTKEGTYLISVHIRGYVRQVNPYKPVDSEYGNWKAISDNVTETSEVKQYTIQVGDALAEMEPPVFGVNPSVPENSPPGTKVGDPILVFNSKAETLGYNLTGEGSNDFKLVPATKPHSVQIVVNEGASLDHETQASYDLALNVTDNVDHENNPNSAVDDTLAVHIDVEDIETRVELTADSTSLKVNNQVNLTATYHDLPANANLSTLQFTWKRFDEQSEEYDVEVATTAVGSNSFSYTTEGTRRFHVLLNYSLKDGSPGQTITSNTVDVTWGR